jgi:anti-anti-sigma regulatory factor
VRARTETIARTALAVDLELSHGRHGAGARIEFHDGADGTLALVRVRGWIESVAQGRLVQILEDLAGRGVTRLALDCSQLRHIDYRLVGALVETLAHLEPPSIDYAVCGLSPHLRDLFRIAGCEPARHEFATAESWIAAPHTTGYPREWAS